MDTHNFVQSILRSVIVTMIVVWFVQVAAAQVMTSSNYALQSDSINVGGGYSSSTSYIQESTAGEIATGESTSATFSLHAGYQQMQEVFLSLSAGADVALSPSLPGITGGTSNGSTTLTVITDSPAGYQLTIAAENDPAMLRNGGAETISDYNPGVDPDFAFTVGAGAAYFGFTPEGVDIVQAFLDDGGTCNTGSLDTALACWDGLSTTTTAIAEGTGSNHPNGATTTINFRVGVGSGAGLVSGVYTATTTVTALPL